MTLEMDKKAIFHLLKCTILNSFMILTSCGSEFSHWLYILGIGKGPNKRDGRGISNSGKGEKREREREREKPNPSTNKKDLTQDTQMMAFGSEENWCCACSAKNKQEQNSSAQNETQGCMLDHVSKYIIPHCISENQLTRNRKNGA